MSELSGAIVSITLVMMAVFIPVSFMTGTSGTFYRQFGLTMAIAIGFSAVNALTLKSCPLRRVPEASSARKANKKMQPDRSFPRIAFNAAYDVTLKKYKKSVLFFIHKRVLSFLIVAGSIVALFLLMKITPTGMVPNEDTGTVFAAVNLTPGTSKERTEAVIRQIDSLVAAHPAVRVAYVDHRLQLYGRTG